MSAFKTYKGGRLDLEHYKGKTIHTYQIDVFNDDDTDFALSVYSDIRIRIYQKIHGTLVLAFDFQGGVVTDSPTGNTIYWNATKSQMDIRPKYYWHECYGVINTNPSVEELIFEGVSEVI
jgi:hypothetical protein